MKFEDRELQQKVSYKLGKFESNVDFSEKDLSRVDELSLSNVSLAGKDLNVNLEGLLKLKKIKRLSLQKFDVSDNILDILNQISSLEDLELRQCTFTEGIQFDFSRLKSLRLHGCKGLAIRDFSFPSDVYITTINDHQIDLRDFSNPNAITSLSINNATILNSNELANFPNLKVLDISGSQLDSDDPLKTLNANKIRISRDDTHLPIK